MGFPGERVAVVGSPPAGANEDLAVVPGDEASPPHTPGTVSSGVQASTAVGVRVWEEALIRGCQNFGFCVEIAKALFQTQEPLEAVARDGDESSVYIVSSFPPENTQRKLVGVNASTRRLTGMVYSPENQAPVLLLENRFLADLLDMVKPLYRLSGGENKNFVLAAVQYALKHCMTKYLVDGEEVCGMGNGKGWSDGRHYTSWDVVVTTPEDEEQLKEFTGDCGSGCRVLAQLVRRPEPPNLGNARVGNVPEGRKVHGFGRPFRGIQFP